MNTNTSLDLALIAAGEADYQSLATTSGTDVAELVQLMRDSKLDGAKTTAGGYLGGAMKALSETGRKNDRLMGLIFAASANNSGAIKEEGYKSAADYFSAVTGLSKTSFQAVKWAGTTVYGPAVERGPESVIAAIAALDVSAGMLYELRALTTSEIEAAAIFLTNPPAQKLYREIGKTVSAYHKLQKSDASLPDFADVVLEWLESNPDAVNLPSIKAWNKFVSDNTIKGASETDENGTSSDSTDGGNSSSTNTPETTSTSPAAYINAFTLIRRGKRVEIGPMSTAVFGETCNAAGYVSLTHSSLPGKVNTDVRYNPDKDEYVIVEWTAISAAEIRTGLLTDAMARMDVAAVTAITTASDETILKNHVETVNPDKVTKALK